MKQLRDILPALMENYDPIFVADAFEEILQAVHELEHMFFISLADRGLDREEYAAKLHRHAVVLTYREQGKTSGLVAFYANDRTAKQAFITTILVDNTRQKKGIGSLLLSAALAYARKCGMQKLALSVNKANDKAIKFYKKHGFLDECPDGSGEVLLVKSLV